MQFNDKQTRAVLGGKKTRHTRPAGPSLTCHQYRAGSSYPVHTDPDDPPVCHVKVQSVTRSTIGATTPKDAHAEGFPTLDQWRQTWDLPFGPLTRKQHDRPVWVIRFEVAEVPRLLTPAARPHHTINGYTDNPSDAMRGEPEAVDPESIHPNWRLGSRGRHGAVRRNEDVKREARTLGRLVREEALSAQRVGVDIDDELAKIRDGLAGIVRKREAA